MALNLQIGTTNKRVNSTKDTISNPTTLNCTLKDPTSMQAPTFIVSGLNKLTVYNYAKFLNRYYWVDDIVWTTNNIQEVHCHLDRLATFKTDISNYSCYVAFGDAAHKTVYKDDPRFGPDHKLLWSAGAGHSGDTTMGMTSTGTIIVVAQNSSTSFAYAGITTYAMSMSTFIVMLRSFSGIVYSDIQTWSTTDFIDVIKNYIIRLFTGGGQAIDNIRSAVWVPVPYSYWQSNCYLETNEIALGPYSITLDSGNTVCVVEPNKVETGNAVINIPRPLPVLGYPWLSSTKYRVVQLTHPCGYLNINCDALMETDKAYLWWAFHKTTGDYVIKITSEADKNSMAIAIVSGNVSQDVAFIIPTSGNTMDSYLHNGIDAAVMNAVMPFGGWGQGRATPNSSGAQIQNIAGVELMNAGAEVFWDIEYMQPAIFEANDSVMYNAFCDEHGYVVGKFLLLSTITTGSFVQCEGASVPLNHATEEDKVAVNNFLNSGFYYE